VTLSTSVAAPNPSTEPVAVLISWKTPRSAIRFATDAFVSWNVALSRFAWFAGSARTAIASALVRAAAAAAANIRRMSFFIVCYLLSDG
jgi:hypothetical protein